MPNIANKIIYSFVDTDVIIRLLTNDDPRKRDAAAKLFEKADKGDLVLSSPDTVIFDAVFVLSSKRLYNLPRSQVRDLIDSLLRISNFKVDNKQALSNALDLFVNTNLDFGDCFLASIVKRAENKIVYSYDRGFDKIKGVIREEP